MSRLATEWDLPHVFIYCCVLCGCFVFNKKNEGLFQFFTSRVLYVMMLCQVLCSTVGFLSECGVIYVREDMPRGGSRRSSIGRKHLKGTATVETLFQGAEGMDETEEADLAELQDDYLEQVELQEGDINGRDTTTLRDLEEALTDDRYY